MLANGPIPADPADDATYVRIGPVDVLATSVAGAVARVVEAVSSTEPRSFGFCNAHTVNMARTSPAFAATLRTFTLFNDGFGLDLASRWLYGAAFPANLNGTDLTPAVLTALPAGTPVYLLGSPPGVADDARAALTARFPSLDFVGSEHGFFTRETESDLAARIRASGAGLVLVGMGHPFQEEWVHRNVEAIGATMLCVGAFLDFTAGRVARAPQWVQGLRAEWLYRLAHEPRRLARRYVIGNAAFLVAVMQEKRLGARGANAQR